MENRSFENFYNSREKTVRTELELLHRMMLDTQAEIVQVKEDALQDPSRAGELISLKIILESLQKKESAFNIELEELKNQS